LAPRRSPEIFQRQCIGQQTQRIDAIIHAACDFDTGMGAIGRATSPSRMAR
jgi:hypothetical protein